MLHSNTILIDWVRLCIHLICYTLTLLPYLHVCLNSLELYFLNKWYNLIVFFVCFLGYFFIYLWWLSEHVMTVFLIWYLLLINCWFDVNGNSMSVFKPLKCTNMQLKKKSARERKTQTQTIQLLLYVEMSELAKPPRQHFCWLLRSVAKAKLWESLPHCQQDY